MLLSAHARNLSCNFISKFEFTGVHRLLHQLANNHTSLSQYVLRDHLVKESNQVYSATLFCEPIMLHCSTVLLFNVFSVLLVFSQSGMCFVTGQHT